MEGYTVDTASQPVEAAQEQQTPTISFSHVIAIAPSSASFGGWGPKVTGNSGVITRLN